MLPIYRIITGIDQNSENKMNDYLLLTPGPLSTSATVKQAMLKDWCTWDDEYNVEIVQNIRQKLVNLATHSSEYTSVLMQGSGTACVEATIGSIIGPNDKLLVVNNGAYGKRIVQIAEYLSIEHTVVNFTESQLPDLSLIEKTIKEDNRITHVAMVHCETTTGILNPAKALGEMLSRLNKVFILDAMSSFGGIPMDVADWHVDALVSSANKCIQGVPGFGFVIIKQKLLESTKGVARSLSLDLYDQWQTMEQQRGKWRFTSPTHVVRAFYQALIELEREGGVEARYKRYHENQSILVKGMQTLGFETLIAAEAQSPIITSFYSPTDSKYSFKQFYQRLKQQGFVIYPGKVSQADCFRIGNIGEVNLHHINALLKAVKQSCYWL